MSGCRALLDLPEKLLPSAFSAASPLSAHFWEGKAQKWVSHSEVVVNLVRAASKLRPQKKGKEAT